VAAAVTTRPDVDLLDPAFHVGDPHPAYRWMRRHEPLYRDRNGVVCVTRMEHVRQVERRAADFVSSKGYRSVWFPDETAMIARDDPEHQAQRRLVSDRFTPRAVTRLEDDVRADVVEALAVTRVADRFEVVDTLAARLPALMTCRVLGWPTDRWRDVRSWSERLMRVDVLHRDPMAMSDATRAMLEIGALAQATLAERAACPAEDMFTRWAESEARGCPMSGHDVTSELGLVIPGGAETTRTTLARSLILLAERPDLWEAMAAEPASIPAAVEELLRWVTPLNNMFRTAAADTEIDGVAIAAGDRLALVYPSANRDDAVFADPDEVELARDPNPHVTFGFGTHFCLGAHVARLVLRVALEELTARLTDLRPLAPPVYEANVFVKAVERFELGYGLR
jgi:cytochrome P450 family 142 subfamily A polypeptide 1